MKKHILYVSHNLPAPGLGSSVILYRHLKRLKGCKISIITFDDEEPKKHKLPKSWNIIKIPEKKRFWPGLSYRIRGSVSLRLMLLGGECKKSFQKEKPDLIINQFGKNSILAYYLSKSWKVPLLLILHDPYKTWAATELDKHVNKAMEMEMVKHASNTFSVSEELNRLYNLKGNKKAKLLRPIPEGNPYGFIEWKGSFSKKPVMAFCGTFRRQYVGHFKVVSECLEKLNGKLIIVSNPGQEGKDLLKDRKNIEFVSPLENKKAMQLVREKASCILVPASMNNLNDYDKTSFPSKLTELVHLGMPTIIIASGKTALTSWAKGNNWAGYIDSLDKNKVIGVLNKVTIKELWAKMAEQSREVALNEFNPDRIHKEFESELISK